jgi:branched-chain amino acid transport system permease protein
MLELKGVRAGYGSFQALFDVSLEVREGEAVGVIGPNGAGKTTLMRVISGLIRPTAGSIVMEGVDLAAIAAHRIVELGIALGLRLPVLKAAGMFISYSRLLAFAAALVGMVLVYLFLSRTYTGAAIRAIAQDRQIMTLMGVDTRRIYLITSALGGALAGLAACLLVLLYDVHPFVGLSFGPIIFLICVLGGLGNLAGGFVAAFVFAEIISLGGLYLDLEWGYVFAFVFFIVMMCLRPEGLLPRRS